MSIRCRKNFIRRRLLEVRRLLVSGLPPEVMVVLIAAAVYGPKVGRMVR